LKKIFFAILISSACLCARPFEFTNWSTDRWLSQDKFIHNLGSYYLANELNYKLKNRFAAASVAFAMGFLYEIKDGFFHKNNGGFFSADGFSVKDFSHNFIGSTLYITRLKAHKILLLFVAAELLINLAQYDKLLPRSHAWQQPALENRRIKFGRKSVFQHNTYISMFIPWITMAEARHYSLWQRAVLATSVVTVYEIINGFVDDRDLSLLGDKTGFSRTDLYIGLMSTVFATLYEFFLYPSQRRASSILVTANLNSDRFFLTLQIKI
jgi:hypothetical protein